MTPPPVPTTDVRKNTDNRRVSARKPRAKVDSAEYAAMVRRVVRGLARRIAAGDIDVLPELVGLETFVTEAIQDAVDGLRTLPVPYSFTDIAARLGMSRQNARKRFSGKETAKDTPANPLAQEPLPFFDRDGEYAIETCESEV
jgi:hypothetical protein